VEVPFPSQNHHINGVFAADIMGSARNPQFSGDLLEMRANALFAGYFCLNDS
jgi:hypothetical protein